MSQSIEKVSAFLFGDEDINAVATDSIQKYADEYPYFPIGQLLLAKKLKAEKTPSFLSQAQKTASFFSNPYLLDYQLTDTAALNFKLNKKKLNEDIYENEEKQLKSFKAKPVQSEPEQNPHKNTDPAFTENDEFGKKDNDLVQKIDINLATENKPEEETPEPETPTELPEKNANEDAEMPVRDKIEEVVQETLLPDEQDETTEVLEEMVGATDESSAETEAFLNEATDLQRSTGGENLPAGSIFKNIRFPEKSSFFIDSKEETEPIQDEHDLMFKNIKAMLDATSEEADADVNDTFVPIDPYYTIDYFASQGIKLDLDPNPKDELGQHLKKFTHWLKQMKKLGPEDATEVIARNNESEADIQKIADSSNTVREVVTEAMALVLEKQGKKDKAIELYNKLSFLNPHKSTYFAGKIKSLKGI